VLCVAHSNEKVADRPREKRFRDMPNEPHAHVARDRVRLLQKRLRERAYAAIKSGLLRIAQMNVNQSEKRHEPAAAANDVGPYYENGNRVGYRRRANGDHFEYLDMEAKRIRDKQRLLRIKRLAIPPAWTDVWICPSPNGHSNRP
jgi:hypothetical protein